MKDLLGGKVKAMITGSAPISGDVLDFLKICFSAPICEGYGMTETCAGSVITFVDDPQTGIVGGPLQNVKIRLRDIPEMNYYHNGTKEDPTPKERYFCGDHPSCQDISKTQKRPPKLSIMIGYLVEMLVAFSQTVL